MKQYTVTGMSCAACSSRVEKAVTKVEGVVYCSVNLLTNSMMVDGTASEEDVINAVEAAGYHASLKCSKRSGHGKDVDREEELQDTETPILKKRLLMSLIFLAVLMYFSMGYMMFGFWVPEILTKNPVALGLIQLLFTVIIMFINRKFFVNGFKGLIHRAPNMDTLVALGSGASFVYSVYALFKMTYVLIESGVAEAETYLHEFYFESAAMILTLITVGKMLEARSKGKTTDAIKSLMKLMPKTATVVVNGVEQVVLIEEVKQGDIFVVKPGESIPVDGIILEGHSAINESLLTGESIPKDKAEGDKVYAATLNRSGFLCCKAENVGEDTTLSNIIRLVSDAAATKAPIAKIADKVSGVFVPVVMTIAVATFIVWLTLGAELGEALQRGIAVLVISCPCALGLATPVAIMVANGVGAKNGILFKTAVALEKCGKANVVVLDKTGTITKGEPAVTDIITVENVSEQELLELAFSLEKKSEHPLAKAVVAYAEEAGINAEEVAGFEALAGNGLRGFMGSTCVSGGSLSFISETVRVTEEMENKVGILLEEGKTPLYFVKDNRLMGVILVADVIKEDSIIAVRELKSMGIYVAMLTGDNKKTANAIGKQVEVNEVIAEVMPEGKANEIRRLKQQGKVIMVGDGLNDAPALSCADIGMAIGAGTDVAIDAAEVVLMKNSLRDVVAAIRLSRSTLRIIHENLFWAFIYNVIGIPLAAGAFIELFHWHLNPMFGAAAMSLSSFCVVSNALRLNFVKLYEKIGKEKNSIKEERENKSMQTVLQIEGMMCGHCEARVKKCLEQLPDVKEAIVSHTEGTAVVSFDAPVDNEVLVKTVEAQDYKVTSVKNI